MRLIDADAFLERIQNDTSLCAEIKLYGLKVLKKYLDLQSTAYDIDKVIEEIKTLKEEALDEYNMGEYNLDNNMSDLISRKKICDYIKGKINPYGKPFEGTAYELGLKIMRYIDSMDSAYSVNKVVEELELHSFELGTDTLPVHYVRLNDAIEIVKQGGIRKDV